jgi:hypothetical protein
MSLAPVLRRSEAKIFVPPQVFESARSVEEAKVQVLVAKEYAKPFDVMARPPADNPLIVSDEVAVIEPTVSLPAVVEARYALLA